MYKIYNMKKRLQIILPFLLLLIPMMVNSQNSVNTAGGAVVGTNGSVSYSIGQTFYGESIGSTGLASEGVQQPYEIFEIGIHDFDAVQLNCMVYPNPTSDYLILKINDDSFAELSLSYSLFDVTGKVLLTSSIVESETTIELSNFPTQTFFLNIIQKSNNKSIKSFKIIKK